MQLPSPLRRLLPALLIVSAGCEEIETPFDHARVEESPIQVDEIALTLETREGTGSLGWSFAQNGLVAAEDADLVLSSFDYGARGRWVTLEAAGTADICQRGRCFEDCGPDLEIGGSDPNIAVGGVFTVEVGREVHAFLLTDRTETPSDWFDSDDLSFHVWLEPLD